MLVNDTNNKNSVSIKVKLKSIIDKIIEDKSYEEGKMRLLEYFKYNISKEIIIKNSLQFLNDIIITKGNSQLKILSVISLICQIYPPQFVNHVDIIISLFQNCFNKEENSPYLLQISQYFGDTVLIVLNDLNKEQIDNNVNNTINNIFLAYNKFKIFCLSNMSSDNNNCQICGTLCLTSFIENCSFNYINKENLKCIFDHLCERINNNKFVAKLEILNCFISLIYCSEEKYLPYASRTLDVIIKFITNKEWLIKKFALNIIYVLLIYYKRILFEKKEFIIDNITKLKNEKNSEIKETIKQIFLLLNEEDINSSESKSPENNNEVFYIINKIKNEEQFDSNNDEEFSNEKIIKTDRESERVIKCYKNKLYKTKIKSKSKPIYERNIIKTNEFNNIKAKKEKKKMIDNINHIIKKIKNKSVEKSRNSLDKYFRKRKQNPSTAVINKRNYISLEKKMPKNKNKNKEFNSLERHAKIVNLMQKEFNIYKKDKIKTNNQIHIIKKVPEIKYLNTTKKRKENNINKSKIIKQNNNYFPERKIKNISVIQKENNKRNNNSFELRQNKNIGNNRYIKVTKQKDVNKNKKRKSNDNKINNDINTSLNNFTIHKKYIKEISPDYSNSENLTFLNINTKNNNISSSSNNNITINNNLISIKDETSSKKEASSSIENNFIEYKNETNKIINELKTQINTLKLTLNNYEQIEKDKKDLINSIKNKNFQKAFELAVNIGNINEVNYVIKNYLLNNKKGIILTNTVIADVMRILCKDILLCDNLRLIVMFIIKNICEKKTSFDKELNKVIYDVFLELYKQRKELCLFQQDINSILKIINYFKNKI